MIRLTIASTTQSTPSRGVPFSLPTLSSVHSVLSVLKIPVFPGNKLTTHLHAKSRSIRTYAKYAPNSFRIRIALGGMSRIARASRIGLDWNRQ